MENKSQYNGWIVSNSFLKRAFAIYGHSLVAALIIMIPLYILMFLVFGAMFMGSMSEGRVNARMNSEMEQGRMMQNTNDSSLEGALDVNLENK